MQKEELQPQSEDFQMSSSIDLLEESNDILAYLVSLQQKKQENDRQNDKLDQDYYSNMKEIEAKQRALNLEMERFLWEEEQLQQRFFQNMNRLFQPSGIVKEHPTMQSFLKVIQSAFLASSFSVRLDVDEEENIYTWYRVQREKDRFEKKALERRNETILLYEEIFSKMDEVADSKGVERQLQLTYYDRSDVSFSDLPLSVKVQMQANSSWNQPSFEVSFSGLFADRFRFRNFSFSLPEFQREMFFQELQGYLLENVSQGEYPSMILDDLQAYFCFDDQVFTVWHLNSRIERVQSYLAGLEEMSTKEETRSLPKVILEMQERIQSLEREIDQLEKKLERENNSDQLRFLSSENLRLQNQKDTEQFLVNISLENFLLGTSSLLRTAAKNYFEFCDSKSVSISQDTVSFAYFHLDKALKEVQTIHLFQGDLYQVREAISISDDSICKYFLETKRYSVREQIVERLRLQIDEIEDFSDLGKTGYRGMINTTHNVKGIMSPKFAPERENVLTNSMSDFSSVRSLISAYGKKRQISFGLAQVSSSQLRGLSEDHWQDIGNKKIVKEKV